MTASQHVREERRRGVELGPLPFDDLETTRDGPPAALLAPVEHLTDLREGESDLPAGEHDPQPREVLLGVLPVPGTISIGDDPWIPVGQAHRLASLLPGTPEVTVLPGVGHLTPIEAPDAVVDAVGALGEPGTGTGLDSVEPGRGPTTLDRR